METENKRTALRCKYWEVNGLARGGTSIHIPAPQYLQMRVSAKYKLVCMSCSLSWPHRFYLPTPSFNGSFFPEKYKSRLAPKFAPATALLRWLHMEISACVSMMPARQLPGWLNAGWATPTWQSWEFQASQVGSHQWSSSYRPFCRMFNRGSVKKWHIQISQGDSWKKIQLAFYSFGFVFCSVFSLEPITAFPTVTPIMTL